MADSFELSQRLKDFKTSYDSANLASVTTGKENLSTSLNTITGKIDNIISLFKRAGSDSVINSLVANVSLCKDAADRIKSHVDSDVDAVLGQIEGVVGTIDEIEELIKTAEDVKSSLNSARSVKEGEEPDQTKIDSLSRRLDNIGKQIEDRNSKGETQLNAIQAAMDGITLGIAGNMQAGGVLGTNMGFNDNYQFNWEDVNYLDEEEKKEEEKTDAEYSATGGKDGKSFTTLDAAIKSAMATGLYQSEEDARVAVEKAVSAGTIRIQPVPDDGTYSATGGKDGTHFNTKEDAIKAVVERSNGMINEDQAEEFIEEAIKNGTVKIKPDDTYSPTGGKDGKSYTSVEAAKKDLRAKSPDYFSDEDIDKAIEEAIKDGKIRIKPGKEDEAVAATATDLPADSDDNNSVGETETTPAENTSGDNNTNTSQEAATETESHVSIPGVIGGETETTPAENTSGNNNTNTSQEAATETESHVNVPGVIGDNTETTPAENTSESSTTSTENVNTINSTGTSEPSTDGNLSDGGNPSSMDETTNPEINQAVPGTTDGIKGEPIEFSSREEAIQVSVDHGASREAAEKAVDSFIEQGVIKIKDQQSSENSGDADPLTNEQQEVIPGVIGGTGNNEESVSEKEDEKPLAIPGLGITDNSESESHVNIPGVIGNNIDESPNDDSADVQIGIDDEFSATGGKDSKSYTTRDDLIADYIKRTGKSREFAEKEMDRLIELGVFRIKEQPEDPVEEQPQAPVTPTPPPVEDPYAGQEYSPTGGKDGLHYSSLDDAVKFLWDNNPSLTEEEAYNQVVNYVAEGRMTFKTDDQVMTKLQEAIDNNEVYKLDTAYIFKNEKIQFVLNGTHHPLYLKRDESYPMRCVVCDENGNKISAYKNNYINIEDIYNAQ